MGDEAGKGGDPMEVLKGWLIARVVSSFKCKPEQGESMGNNEASVGAIMQFFGDEECQRLLVYAAPDLTAVRVCLIVPPFRSHHRPVTHPPYYT